MPARGPGFSALRRRLNALQHVEGLPDVLGVAAVKLVADGFRKQQDPYGVAWRGLSYRKGKILRKTDRMFNSTTYDASPRRARVAITAWYSVIHQDGARVRRARATAARSRRTATRQRVGEIVRRPMVPDERGLPPAWERVLQRDTTAFLRRISGGR